MKLKPSFGFLFIFILLLNLFFRLNKINSNPPSLFSDEVDAGYQAFVFNQQQTDYHGHQFPSHFQSFSDYRTPLYIYSIAFVQKIIGYRQIAVRLPAIIFGFLSSIVFSLIIFSQSKKTNKALLALILFSISPWAIHYSRIGFEVTGMLLCLLLGIYFWHKFSKNQNNKHLYLSVISFSLSPYFYATSKLFIVFILISLLLAWPKIFKKINQKTKITTLFICLFLFLPIIKDTLNGTSGYRFSYISIFSDPTIPQSVNYQRQLDSFADHGLQVNLKPSLSSKLAHNKISLSLSKFVRNYFSSFSTEFLLLKGDDNLRHGFGTKGYLLYPSYIFLFLGLSLFINKLFTKTKAKKLSIFFFILLILAPIPFSLTRDSLSPHATRLIIMLPSLLYFSTQGLSFFINFLKNQNKVISISALFLLGIFYLTSFADFYYYYFHRYPHLSASAWHSNIKQTINLSLQQNSEKIFYSNSYESFVPFFLYYQSYLPKQKSITKDLVWDNSSGFSGRQIEDKYYFGKIEWNQFLSQQKSIENYLFVIPKQEMETVKNSLQQLNLNINLNQEIKSPYEMAETFYLISLKQ